jgi:hypothetical protein
MRISFLFFLLLFPASLFANELLQKIQEDQFLLLGYVGIVEYSDEKYIISVGEPTSTADNQVIKRKSMIEAKAKSYSQLSKFIHENEMRDTEQLNTIETLAKTNNSRIRGEKSEYFETIQEKNEGPLKRIENIGSWTTKEYFYWVTGIKIPKPSN